MSEKQPSFNRVAIASHPKIKEAVKENIKIAEFLKDFGIQTIHGFLFDEKINKQVRSGEIDLLIALGGDGSMLRAGHICGPVDVPILGVNLGRFGFLMEIRQHQWEDYLPRLLDGNFWLEKRMMLHAEQNREDSIIGRWEVLNEVVVGRGELVRPVHLVTAVDDRFLTTYVADGLIASTPTGSTAYALAAGGPILPPELRNILLVPVAPHLSVDRAIILAEGSSVTITVHTDHHAVLSADGQDPITLKNNDMVMVKASEYSAKFIRFHDPGYFYRNLTPHMNQNPSTSNKQ